MGRRWVVAATAITVTVTAIAVALVVASRRDRPSDVVTAAGAAGPGRSPSVSSSASAPIGGTGARKAEGVVVSASLRSQPGTRIGGAEAAQPVGAFGLRGYRVDELTVDPPVAVTVRGARVQVTRALRLTVTGGPFPIRDQPARIWVGDRDLGVAVENRNRSELSVITFDVDALPSGATIAVAYGDRRYALPVRVGG
jgi:hypothetical protein